MGKKSEKWVDKRGRELVRPVPPKAYGCEGFKDMATYHQRVAVPEGVEMVPAGYVYREVQFMSGNRYTGLTDVTLKLEGDGTMEFANGDDYQGQWFDGRRHGARCSHSGVADSAGADRRRSIHVGERKHVHWQFHRRTVRRPGRVRRCSH